MNKTLIIRFTSDTHGYLYPTNYADNTERPMGLFRAAAEFPHDGNTLILDGGDTIQGSPMTNYYHRLSCEEQQASVSSPLHGTNPFAAAMNLAGYQYVTLGNHDFNNGIGALADYLDNLNAQCLCCNIRDKARALPIRPYAIHTLENGLRVGLIGACTHFVTVWEKKETLDQLEIEPPVPAIARVYDEVKAQSDVTVLLYHGGFECDLQTRKPLTTLEENQACLICDTFDFDLVLTGHQHIAVAGQRYGNSYVVQPAYRAPHVCAITLTVRENGEKEIQSSLIPSASRPMPDGLDLVSPLENRVQNWLDTKIGSLSQPLPSGDHLDMAVNGCLLTNFVNAMQRRLTGAQIATCALANEYKGIPKDVTVRDIVSAYIYTNTMIVLRLSRNTLKAYMERSAEYFDHDEAGNLCVSPAFMRPKISHYNYDHFSGVDYVIDTTKPHGERITSIRIDGHEMAADETVTVCINTYRNSGTGGYGMLLGQELVLDLQTDIAEALIDCINGQTNMPVDTHQYCTVII